MLVELSSLIKMELPFGKKEGEGGGGLFGKKKEEAPAPTIPPEILSEINDITRRLKILEEKFIGIEREVDVSNKNAITENKKLHEEVDSINDDMLEVKRDIDMLKKQAAHIIESLMDCARKEDVDKIDRYVDLINPMNFVSRDQLRRIIREVLEEEGVVAKKRI